MDVEVLKRVGFTENDIKVYLALLDLGSASATRIAKEAQVHRSKTYESLQRLIDKGVVHYTKNDFKKQFSVNHPHSLHDALQVRQEELNQTKANVDAMMPELLLHFSQDTELLGSNIYEGASGIRIFHSNILRFAEESDEIVILGIPPAVSALMEGSLLAFHEERLRKGINMRMLYEYDSKDTAKHRLSMAHTQVRVLPKELRTAAVTFLFRNRVGLMVFAPKPMCFEILSQSLADSYRSYFEYLWTRAEEP